MTPEAYYRRATWVPFLLPLVAAGVVALMIVVIPGPKSSAIRWLVDVAQFLTLAGVVSIVPYGLYLWLFVVRRGPMTESEWRRLSWLAPSYIATPFALAMGLIAIPLSGPRGAFTFAWYVGLIALATGYFYALVINGVLLVLKRGGCVRNPAEAR